MKTAIGLAGYRKLLYLAIELKDDKTIIGYLDLILEIYLERNSK